MTRKLDMGSPAAVLASAGRYTDAVHGATAQLRSTAGDLVPGATGSSPLDVYATGVRRTVKGLLTSAAKDTDARIEPIVVGTPPATARIGLQDDNGATGIGRYRSV